MSTEYLDAVLDLLIQPTLLCGGITTLKLTVSNLGTSEVACSRGFCRPYRGTMISPLLLFPWLATANDCTTSVGCSGTKLDTPACVPAYFRRHHEN